MPLECEAQTHERKSEDGGPGGQGAVVVPLVGKIIGAIRLEAFSGASEDETMAIPDRPVKLQEARRVVCRPDSIEREQVHRKGAEKYEQPCGNPSSQERTSDVP